MNAPAIRVCACLLMWLLACASTQHAAEQAVATAEVDGTVPLVSGPLGTVHVYRPKSKVQAVVLFLSGDGGWQLGVVTMARALANDGTVVAAIDVRRYVQPFGASKERCRSLAADFGNLSHSVQKQLHLEQYRLPILAGYSSGATLAYAPLVQAPARTFAGAMSPGFCPDQDMGHAVPCSGAGLAYSRTATGTLRFEPTSHLADPWIVWHGQEDQVCSPLTVETFAQATPRAELVRLPWMRHGFGVERDRMPQFSSAYGRLALRAQPPALASGPVSDLPLVEVLPTNSAVQPSSRGTDSTLAVFLSGDGGWAGLDREVCAQLAANGVPVVGFNTLRYFWQARTPEETAQDIARTMNYYMQAWSRTRVLLIGYSLGADVLPFVVNRLPARLRDRVGALVLIGLSSTATFEIHVSGWLPGATVTGEPVAPELARLDATHVLCLYGDGEHDSLCPALARAGARALKIGSGHHLGGHYTEIARAILELARTSANAPDQASIMFARSPRVPAAASRPPTGRQPMEMRAP